MQLAALAAVAVSVAALCEVAVYQLRIVLTILSIVAVSNIGRSEVSVALVVLVALAVSVALACQP